MIIDVFIEISKGSRNKYELDKDSGRLKLDRVLRSAVAYPADYGLIPDTLSDDGDSLDVLLITRFPLMPGCLVSTRPIAIFKMIDTGENDEKIIAVPEGDNYFELWKDVNDIPEALSNEITQFFATYKALEKNKYVKPIGWGNVKEAEALIRKSFKNNELCKANSKSKPKKKSRKIKKN